MPHSLRLPYHHLISRSAVKGKSFLEEIFSLARVEKRAWHNGGETEIAED